MFNRLMQVIRGFFGMFVSGLENDNPQALIEAEKENLRSDLAKFNENLANQAGFVEKLKRIVKNDTLKERELSAKIKANVAAGNQKVAGQLALQYKELKARMVENEAQLADAEANYQKLEHTRDITVKNAEARLNKLQNKISQVQMAEAHAGMIEMSNKMNSGVGLNSGNLGRIEQIVDDRLDKARGRARVAGTTNPLLEDNSVVMKEAEMDALGSDALAEFMAMGNDQQAIPILPDAVEELPQAQVKVDSFINQ